MKGALIYTQEYPEGVWGGRVPAGYLGTSGYTPLINIFDRYMHMFVYAVEEEALNEKDFERMKIDMRFVMSGGRD